MASIVDERGFNQGFKLTPAQQQRLRRRAEAMVAEMKLPAAPEARALVHILELGCGTGELAYHLATLTQVRVTGVDLSPRFIAEATARHQHPGLDFMVADLAQPPPEAQGGQHHYIVGNGILHHLYFHLDAVLPALACWLAPGGRLIFWEPNLRNPYVFLIFSFPRLRRWARLEPDEMAFTAGFLRKKLQQAGYRNIHIAARDFLLPNTPRFLIRPVVFFGDILERIPGLRSFAQSVFVSAGRA